MTMCRLPSSGINRLLLLLAIIVALTILIEPVSSTGISLLRSTAGISQNRALPSSQVQTSPIKQITIPQNNSVPLGITTDANGNVWFAENNISAIGEYLPTQGLFKTYPIPTNSSGLIWFMIFDNQGNLWFSNAEQPFLWRFSPITLQFSNFTTGSPAVDPYALAYNSATEEIWFTSIYTDQIGAFQISGNGAFLVRLINTTGTILPGASPPYFGPAGIALDSQGNVYVAEPFSSNIVEYNPTSQRFVQIWNLPRGSEPVGIVVDATRNRVWFSNHASSLFGYVDEKTGNVIQYASSLFTLQGDNITLPYWIQEAADGTIWFDEHIGNKIAHFNPATGDLTEFAVPTSQSAPLRFTTDNRQGVVWFTEFAGNKLGELDLNQSCSCSVSLSESLLTLSNSNRSSTFYVNSNESTLTSPPPLVSGSLMSSGYVGSNLTISATQLNSTEYRLDLGIGSDLTSGNYTITVCPSQSNSDTAANPPPIRECATALLVVNNLQTSEHLNFALIGVGTAAVLITLTISLIYVKRWRG
jgi:virginiamycin B lyase